MSAVHKAVSPPAETNTELHAVPANTAGTYNLIACNRTDGVIPIRVAHVIGPIANLGDPSWIEYDTQLRPGAPLHITKLVAAPTDTIVVYAELVGVSFNLHGFEAAEG